MVGLEGGTLGCVGGVGTGAGDGELGGVVGVEGVDGGLSLTPGESLVWIRVISGEFKFELDKGVEDGVGDTESSISAGEVTRGPTESGVGRGGVVS